jgi:tetratricopeptide (TPR) repeat protein
LFFLLLLIPLIGLLIYWLDPWRWRAGPPDGAARLHWQEAQSALESREYALAKAHLEQALEANPLNAQAQFVMAQTCRRMDDPSGWSAHLRKAVVLGWPQNQIQLELRLKEAQTANTWNVEAGLVEELNSRTPEQAIILEALVKGYLENDRFKDAHRLAETWVHDHPEDWQARLYRGRAFQQGVFFQQAITDYESVLEAKPDQPQAQLWVAETLISDRQYAPALEYYQAFVRAHPDHPESLQALLGVANCRYSLGEVDAARNVLDEILSKRKDYTAALLLRAQLEQSQSPEGALPWLMRAEATAPNDQQVLQLLVLALRALNRPKEAEKYQRRLDERKPKLEELIKLKTRLLQDAENVDLRFQIAKLYLAVGEEDESAHWFQTVLWIDPAHRPTFQALADYWQKKGNLTLATHFRYLAEGKTPPDVEGTNSPP